jgi:hypothetical protein
LNLTNIIPQNRGGPSADADDGINLSLMYYDEDILSILYEKSGRPNDSRILAIRTDPNVTNERRLMKVVAPASTTRLFVRHTGRYLYYGTYSAMGDHGHHEWEIESLSLDAKYPLPRDRRPVQLSAFYGTDIGFNVAFEIHNGFFYAISNQTSFDVEELDWTSFYHCVRFPLDEPVEHALQVNNRVYRRQHAEGPIHDSWTNLTMQVDEATNKPVVVESRREWLNGSSQQLRTFYISDLEVFHTLASEAPDEHELIATGSSSSAPEMPADTVYARIVDDTNNPNYAPVQPRCNRNFHEEYGPGSRSSRPFAFTKTKFRAYNYSSSTFLDLVEDDRCCNDPIGGRCLRLRVGARRVAPRGWIPPDSVTSSKGKSASPYVIEEDPVRYRHSNIKLWPPPAAKCACSAKLHKILNPPLAAGSMCNRAITGAADERSLVYMVKPVTSYTSEDKDPIGTVVVIKFNQEETGQATTGSAGEESTCHDDPLRWRWVSGACRKSECY